MRKHLSIIMPAFNEQERLGESVGKILAYIKKENLSAELLIIDDGSTDSTAAIAEKSFAEFPAVQTKVIRYKQNRGKGYAVKVGLLASVGEIALFSDADLSTPIEELPKLVEPIKDGKYDVTFGSRALDRNLIGVHQPWRREQSGKVFNLFVRTITGLPFWDTQCGFKAFNMQKFRQLLPLMTIDRFGFDVEFLYVAYQADLQLKEIPVRWNHRDGTTVSFLRDSRRMFNEIRQIRQNAKRGLYVGKPQVVIDNLNEESAFECPELTV